MIAAIRSEMRKLLTVRSTYVFVLAGLAIVALSSGFGTGYRSSAAELSNPGLLAGQANSSIVFVGLIYAFVGLLLVGHEYRFNTIMYTLTATNRRWKSFAAKIVVVSIFAIIISLITALFAPLVTLLGAQLHGAHITGQTFDVVKVLAQCVFAGWAYAMLALVFVGIIRNQVGAIIAYLIVPLIGESILSVLLKANAHYLPFTSLQAVGNPALLARGVSSGESAVIAVAYVVVGLLLATILYTRRDAN